MIKEERNWHKMAWDRKQVYKNKLELGRMNAGL